MNNEEIVELKERTVCSFRIDIDLFKSFLKYIKSVGVDSSGSKVGLISDCILRFDNKGRMWAMVTDDQRNLVVQVKVNVKDINNPVNIPIEIEEIEKWLKSFKNKGYVEVVSEKGFIGLKSVIIKALLNLNTDIVFSTKREDTIICDLISNLEYGDEADKVNLENIKKLGNSIYKEGEDGVELFFGIKLTNSLEISAKQLKEVIADGDRIENREYPFNFQMDKLNVTIKSSDVAKKEKISRDLYSENYNVKEPFTITFSNRLTNAVNNISGDLKIFAEKEAPMLIQCDKKGIYITYLITTF